MKMKNGKSAVVALVLWVIAIVMLIETSYDTEATMMFVGLALYGIMTGVAGMAIGMPSLLERKRPLVDSEMDKHIHKAMSPWNICRPPLPALSFWEMVNHHDAEKVVRGLINSALHGHPTGVVFIPKKVVEFVERITTGVGMADYTIADWSETPSGILAIKEFSAIIDEEHMDMMENGDWMDCL
jgi:hypothetical protein